MAVAVDLLLTAPRAPSPDDLAGKRHPLVQRWRITGIIVLAALLGWLAVLSQPALGGVAADDDFAVLWIEGDQLPSDRIADTATSRDVWPKVETLLIGWTVYQPSRCRSTDTGTFRKLTNPKHGEVVFRITSLKAASGPCAGRIMRFNAAYYTWTDEKKARKPDIFNTLWESGDKVYSDRRKWSIKRGPRIYRDGKDVTDDKIKIKPGERVILEGRPSLPRQNQSWTVPGKIIGGYTPAVGTPPSGKVLKPDLTRTSILVYWTDGGSHEVRYRAQPPGKPAGAAEVKFEVEDPGSGAASVRMNNVRVIGKDEISLGSVNSRATVGIRFDGARSNVPKGGKLRWVQIVNYDKTSALLANGKRETCSDGPGLDSSYPYDDGNATDDSPSTTAGPFYRTHRREMSSRMHLMWISTRTGAVPVPLGYVDWIFRWDADRDPVTGAWRLKSSSKSFKAFRRSSSYPEWSTILVNNSSTCVTK